ncbi:uncharacterized protein LOC118740010 [Rhagoletis pomonella]|uniref:uncharacterized protein LOC118740010 n=1 Tax=Rhagoletis pomonella TaxID=28610 RepID=UPI0017868F45|nr:uncharacterized protein LOC118740010 [Rhagoletis pomonella]
MLTIPRLELQAAILGARLAKSIIEAHSVSIKQCYFWTDSRTVLSWINSDLRRYQQFVSYRISEILETTEPFNWHSISTYDNVADEATKWKKVPEVSVETRWFNGPPFLKLEKKYWPVESFSPGAATTVELRAQYVGTHHEGRLNEFIALDPNRYSSWRRLLTMTAAVVYSAKIWLSRVRPHPEGIDGVSSYRTPRTEDFKLAEIMLWRQAQFDTYKEEIYSLKHGKFVERSSSLYKLSPYLDGNNIMRLGSRLTSKDRNDLVILPKSHRITHLIVADFHTKYHHRNLETVVNDVRQRYWVPRLRVVVNEVQKQCQRCKLNKAKPKPPIMGQLPSARVSAFCRPFTQVTPGGSVEQDPATSDIDKI